MFFKLKGHVGLYPTFELKNMGVPKVTYILEAILVELLYSSCKHPKFLTL
jgi:hypothetical protein